MAELKPCPFCGGKAKMQRFELRYYKGCYDIDISCEDCACKSIGLPTDTVYRSIEQAEQNAVENWNRRSTNEK